MPFDGRPQRMPSVLPRLHAPGATSGVIVDWQTLLTQSHVVPVRVALVVVLIDVQTSLAPAEPLQGTP